MPNLKVLYLTNDTIEDVTPLSNIKTLEELNIEGNYVVSQENVGDLITALPNCEITHSNLKTQLELELLKPLSDTDTETDTETDSEEEEEEDSETDSEEDNDESEEPEENEDEQNDTDSVEDGTVTITTTITEYYE